MTARVAADAAARASIRSDLSATLFVEAGAGSGKTTTLVDRVVALVLAPDGAPLHRIAAVTFTEKAAAELRDRVRGRLEEIVRTLGAGPDVARAQEALEDLDSAAIGTLHSFARRTLTEHPIEARLPPLISVADEVGSQVAFESRWRLLLADLLEEESLAETVLLALACGVQTDQLRSIASEFNHEWDRLETAVLAGPEPVPVALDVSVVVTSAQALLGHRGLCVDDTDLFLGHLASLETWLTSLVHATDDAARLRVLAQAQDLKKHNGRRGSWPGCDLEELRTNFVELKERCAALHAATMDTLIRTLARRLAVGTLGWARERQQEGTLEFHDLLVLARELVLDAEHGADVRAALHERYQRLLLDEFQDTDPIQIELAVRIAGGRKADAADWRDVAVPDGRLFVVGDPKQSIYRFRRADIATYLDAQSRLGEPLSLTTNFRTTPALLDWVNDAFAELITAQPGSQPAYQRLDEWRAGPIGGSRLIGLGGDEHPSDVRADGVRRLEAADVARTVRSALAEEWPVFDEALKAWRPLRLDDVAILVPARTSLPFLEDALDDAGIPFRAEASSLVYRTDEVRDLLMAARALDDPSDGLALVAALRSSLFGCGDDDLWTWKQGGGSFNLLAPPPEAIPHDHPVHESVTYLRTLFDERTWLAPSLLLDRLVRDRRLLESAIDGPRTRDVWRRVRFVIDQARAWSEVEHGGLRSYLKWARRQGDEATRVAEAVLPETDLNAVRVLTIHAAKGLEFPMVIVSGMSSRIGGNRGQVDVLWTDGGYEIKLAAGVQTGDFEVAAPIDEQMDHYERLRLMYVACTRARDHLVVSMHRSARRTPVRGPRLMTNAELIAGTVAAQRLDELQASEPGPRPVAQASTATHTEPYAVWSARATARRASTERRSTFSASSLEGLALPRSIATVTATTAADDGLAKGARNLELPPWNKGRYGSAIGRAVHGTLQIVDLSTGAGLLGAAAAQAVAEGVAQHEAVVVDLCRQALASDVVALAATRRHWREMYVGSELDDGTVVEGYIDLVYAEDDGSLVVVDYKTDALLDANIDARVEVYRPQMAAYVHALSRATGVPVRGAVLLFLHPTGHAVRNLPADELGGFDEFVAAALGSVPQL